jgi:hypothetical protein
MPRINLDLDFLTHPKSVSIEPLAQLLFIRGLIYSAMHLTDGFLPVKAVRHLAFDLPDYERNHDSELHARGIGCDIVTEASLVEQLINIGMWELGSGGWQIHDYLEYQLSRKDVETYKENKQLAGRSGGLAKAKQVSSKVSSKASGKVLANCSPIPIPIPIPKKEEDKTLVRWHEQAVEFWKAYPKKTGKGNVEKWFKHNKPSDDLFKQMLDKIEQMKLSHDWIKDGGKFIPMPYTWLNQKRWEDELPSPPARKCVL